MSRRGCERGGRDLGTQRQAERSTKDHRKSRVEDGAGTATCGATNGQTVLTLPVGPQASPEASGRTMEGLRLPKLPKKCKAKGRVLTKARVRASLKVKARESIKARARDSIKAKARESIPAKARESIRGRARDSNQGKVRDSTKAKAKDMGRARERAMTTAGARGTIGFKEGAGKILKAVPLGNGSPRRKKDGNHIRNVEGNRREARVRIHRRIRLPQGPHGRQVRRQSTSSIIIEEGVPSK